MLPLSDGLPARRFPVVNVALIAANLAVWIFYELPDVGGAVAQSSFYPCDVDRTCQSPLPWPISWLTAMFMHASWSHLLGNLLFLAIFGKNVEDAFGRLRYLGFYLAGGFAATALETITTLLFGSNADALIPLLGASGASRPCSGRSSPCTPMRGSRRSSSSSSCTSPPGRTWAAGSSAPRGARCALHGVGGGERRRSCAHRRVRVRLAPCPRTQPGRTDRSTTRAAPLCAGAALRSRRQRLPAKAAGHRVRQWRTRCAAAVWQPRPGSSAHQRERRRDEEHAHQDADRGRVVDGRSDRTTVEFEVEHYWGLHTVRGRFRRFDGVYFPGPAGPEIELTLAAGSVDTGNSARDGHLRLPASSTWTSIRRCGSRPRRSSGSGTARRVNGELDVAGTSAPLSFEASVRMIGADLEMEATTTVDQRRFGLNQGPFRNIRPPTKVHVRLTSYDSPTSVAATAQTRGSAPSGSQTRWRDTRVASGDSARGAPRAGW